MTQPVSTSLLAPAILVPALGQSLTKLDPRALVRNPVIAVTALASLLATIFWVRDLTGRSCRRRARQGAGGKLAQDPLRNHSQAPRKPHRRQCHPDPCS